MLFNAVSMKRICFFGFSRFWLLKRWGLLGESNEKEKFVTKIFFQIMLNEVLKSFKNKKMT